MIIDIRWNAHKRSDLNKPPILWFHRHKWSTCTVIHFGYKLPWSRLDGYGLHRDQRHAQGLRFNYTKHWTYLGIRSRWSCIRVHQAETPIERDIETYLARLREGLLD